MKAKAWILPTVLNLLLLATLEWHLNPGHRRASTAAENQPTDAPSLAPLAATVSEPSPENKLPVTRHIGPQPFHWSQVESTNYPSYIANLRAIGCPEMTIRDIIAADVHAMFESARKQALKAQPDYYWQSDYRVVTPELKELTEIAEQENRILHDLIGSTAPQLTSSESGLNSQAFEELPPALQSKQDLLNDWHQRHAAARDAILVAANDRDLTDKEWQRLSELARQEEEELEILLTETEREEYDLRYSSSADLLREELAGVDVTETEFRRLLKLRQEYDRYLSTMEETAQSDIFTEWQSFQEGVRQILDAERFEVFAARSNLQSSSN